MNKILKSCSNTKEKLESVYKNDGTLTDTNEETLSVMEAAHFKGGPNNDNRVPQFPSHLPPNDLLNKIYDHQRLANIVKSFEPDKAAGLDGLQPLLIQKAWVHIKYTTQRIMQASHKYQHVPTPWRESKGIFLPKPGKTDYCQAKSFRTITLTPVLLKVQEKAILWHMNFDLNMAEQMSERQFGFKKGSSTETALHKIVRCIERRIVKKGFVLGTFLDIEGAFDNVSFAAITSSINNSPVDESTAGWIIDMVTNRYITIDHKHVTRRIRVKRGCPQGGILSPFLWNLIIDDLLRYTANDIPGYLQGFADDLVTLTEGEDLEVIRTRTQKTINTIERWCETKGLNISALKTKIVMFTWRRKWSLPKPIKVGGMTIELSGSVKFLGVTLDSKLSFKDHITNITKKATANLMQCKRAVGPTWGLTPKASRWIYLTVVRPILAYSSVVWVNALNTQTNTNKLERVQRLALLMITGAMPSTSSINLNKLTNIPDIVTYLKGEAAKGASRLQAYEDWTVERNPIQQGTIKPHSSLNNSYLEDLNLPKAEQDLTKARLTLQTKYQTLIPERGEIAELINNISTEAITCYTDGSKTERGTGFGYVIPQDGNSRETQTFSAKLPDFCSVYQAELIALTAAAEAITGYTNREIYLLTDSQASINTLTKPISNSKTAIDCRRALNDLATNNSVAVVWIAGHEGHWGNELADQAAKEGTVSENSCRGYLPQSHIKHAINNRVREDDTKIWTAKGPRHSKLALNNNQEHIKNLTRLHRNRNEYRTAVHLITGHAGLNYHLHKLGKVSSKTCPNCEGGDETVGHFLGQCPAFAAIRGEIFNTYYASLSEIFDNHSISEIVRYANKTKRLRYDPTGGADGGVT